LVRPEARARAWVSAIGAYLDLGHVDTLATIDGVRQRGSPALALWLAPAPTAHGLFPIPASSTWHDSCFFWPHESGARTPRR